jgi:hypothetical protein
LTDAQAGCSRRCPPTRRSTGTRTTTKPSRASSWHRHSRPGRAPGHVGQGEQLREDVARVAYGHARRVGGPASDGRSAPRVVLHSRRQAKPGLVEGRDEKLGVSAKGRKQGRQDPVTTAKPQCGVEALRRRMPGAATALLPGVTLGARAARRRTRIGVSPFPLRPRPRRARASPLDHFSRSARLCWWKR